MADRFWVGGAGNWSSTAKWSDTSGGASGFSVPTSGDAAIFDANSGGKFTATVDTAQSVGSLTITPSSGAGLLTISLTNSLTTGALTTTGTAGNNRVFFTSTTRGISINFVVNGAVSISDCDFRGLYVLGTSAPISGTRIGNRGECRGVTFSTLKTVYWNLAGAQNWSANGWASTSTGTPSTDNFPLPQDIATFTDAGSVTGTITLDSAIAYTSAINMSGRTSAMTLAIGTAQTVYGSWTNGSGTTLSGALTLTFSGGTTQTITSAGKTFPGPITVDTFDGTVQLADAFNNAITTNNLTVTTGTFDTQGYAVTINSLVSIGRNIRIINLGASNFTLTTFDFTISNKEFITFNAGTSTINITGLGTIISVVTGLTFYNVSFNYTGTSPIGTISGGDCTFNNLTIAASAFPGLSSLIIGGNLTINGTLTCAGASAIRRIYLSSTTNGTQRTLTVNNFSAADCDFRDINLAGAASGSSPTRAGDCGNNTGITFPAAKTVYWNLAGSQNWSAEAWATSSGGSPAANNFPLAQDAAVFDDTGLAGTVLFNANFNIGTFDASLRTSAMTLNPGTIGVTVFGDWKFGTGVTSSSNFVAITFAKNGTQTITSNGVQFNCPITINYPNARVQLADAFFLDSTRTLLLTRGGFNASNYNVTVGLFRNNGFADELIMGSGTWTLTGTGSVWDLVSFISRFSSGTSTIVLSDTSTAARTFNGNSLYYNKLTIGGTTGTSTLTITGNNTFGELASTKTVAHTIAFGTTTSTFGKWSVTGTVGNVVTITGTGTANLIAGLAVTGIDYLAMGSWGISSTSPGEFYAGANSTGTAAAPVFRAVAPAARTLYWVGGTGNWSSTTKWSTSSGGASGAAIPTSFDTVNFNSASNATSYDVTIDAGVAIARCAVFTMAGPASGSVTVGGSVGIAFHGNVSVAATGISWSNNGAIALTGSGSYTITTNGTVLNNITTVNGIGATWTLGSSLNLTTFRNFIILNGTFNTSASSYSLTCGSFQTSAENIRSVFLNGSTLTVQTVLFNNFFSPASVFNAGTSQINANNTFVTFNGAAQVFNNVSFTSTSLTNVNITGNNTFNTLSFPSRTTAGITAVTFSSNQTITTLTLNAGASAACRTFLAASFSNVDFGTTRTLTVGTLTAGAADIDFRDVVVTGAAAPLTGTRFGDAKGNSGITFPAAKTVYWAVNTANWGSTGTGSWSATSGGAAAADQFPLAQDTAVFPAAIPTTGSTATINANYNVGSIDMSLRTGNTMTLATGTTVPYIYGNWINGTGTTLSGTGQLRFAGRSSQTITSAGRTFVPPVFIITPGGSVTLQDAFVTTASLLTLNFGTFDSGGYAVTGVGFDSNNQFTRTLAINSSTWTFSASGTAWNTSNPFGFTVTGTGTISLTAATTKIFFPGSTSLHSGITINQGGAGTLDIASSNTFKNITNTYSATGATSISLNAEIITLTQPWTATGAATRVLTVSGTSPSFPGTLVFTGAGVAADVDYLAITNVKAYNLVSTWYAGPNSTNGGSLGWYFIALPPPATYDVFIAELASGVEDIFANGPTQNNVSEAASGVDAISSRHVLITRIVESAIGTDQVVVGASQFGTGVDEAASSVDEINTTINYVFNSEVDEASSGLDDISAIVYYRYAATVNESATGLDQVGSTANFFAALAEFVSGLDSFSPAGSSYNSGVAENIAALDLFGALYLWNLIDDDQNASWALVNDSQAPGWSSISDETPATWQNVNNTQASGWVDVNNAQTPGWAPINP
jgi:hypothetical protein